MVKKTGPKNSKNRPEAIGDSVFALLQAMGGARPKAKFAALWDSWEEVMGPALAAMATPAGHKDRSLLLTAEDAMDIQELRAQADEILALVNGFLKEEYFLKVKIDLARH
ncbi:MAG: DUF721 domain-containing protein [Desulfovibrio sp.]|nr:DUF721 domain-containing protein [Desulfovibrio sp.]